LIKSCKGGDIISDRYLALQNRAIKAERLLEEILIFLDTVHTNEADILSKVEEFLMEGDVE